MLRVALEKLVECQRNQRLCVTGVWCSTNFPFVSVYNSCCPLKREIWGWNGFRHSSGAPLLNAKDFMHNMFREWNFFSNLKWCSSYPVLTSQLVTREQISDRTARNSQQLNIPLSKTAAGRRSFHYMTVTLWNSLDKDLNCVNVLKT